MTGVAPFAFLGHAARVSCAARRYLLKLLGMEGRPASGTGGAELRTRVRDILDQALRLPPPARAAYLDEACGTDASLRGEVKSQLAAAAQSAFFDRPAVPDAPTVTIPAAPTSGAPTFLGQIISHYQIASKISEGGMGTVYKAVDTNLGRPVALKVISRSFISPDDKRRFAREAKAASSNSNFAEVGAGA